MKTSLLALSMVLTANSTFAQVKVYISADMEGISGVVTGEQLGPSGFEYARFREIMTDDVCHCYEDQSTDDVMQDMRDIQIRRVPVVSRDDHQLIGIVALADLVECETDDSKTAQTLLEISAPLPAGQASTPL